MRRVYVIMVLSIICLVSFMAVTFMASQAVIAAAINNKAELVYQFYNMSNLSFLGAIGSAIVFCISFAWMLSEPISKIISSNTKKGEQ